MPDGEYEWYWFDTVSRMELQNKNTLNIVNSVGYYQTIHHYGNYRSNVNDKRITCCRCNSDSFFELIEKIKDLDGFKYWVDDY